MTTSDEWRPVFEPDEQIRLKWGYNSETGDVAIWEVGGPGDGFPIHRDHLTRVWGRDPRPEAGDALGTVTQHGETLTIVTYYGASVPPALIDRLREQFPGSSIAQHVL